MPLRSIDHDVVAGFRCPVCESPVKSSGFFWKCTRKGCCFKMGRKWVRDPLGVLYHPRTLDYTVERTSYLMEVETEK